MKKLNNTLFITGVAALLLVAGNGLTLLGIKNSLIDGAPPEWVGASVAIMMIVLGLCIVIDLAGSFLQFRHFKDESILRSGIFVLGIFALFLIAVDATMLQDIGHEYMLNYDSLAEWQIVFGSHILQAVFALLVIVQCSKVYRKINRDEVPMIVMDEATFLTVHQVGVFSAVLGFFCIIALKSLDVPAAYVDGLMVLSSVVALIPYGLAVVYWLYTKRKEKPVNWYDEKQWIDLSRAALITIVISVVVMTGVFITLSTNAATANRVIWFPVYLCSTLLVFSVSNVVIAHN